MNNCDQIILIKCWNSNYRLQSFKVPYTLLVFILKVYVKRDKFNEEDCNLLASLRFPLYHHAIFLWKGSSVNKIHDQFCWKSSLTWSLLKTFLLLNLPRKQGDIWKGTPSDAYVCKKFSFIHNFVYNRSNSLLSLIMLG